MGPRQDLLSAFREMKSKTTSLQWSLYGGIVLITSTWTVSNLYDPQFKASHFPSNYVAFFAILQVMLFLWITLQLIRTRSDDLLPLAMYLLSAALWAFLWKLLHVDLIQYYSAMVSLIGTIFIALVVEHGLHGKQEADD